jgi:hypothetical protein
MRKVFAVLTLGAVMVLAGAGPSRAGHVGLSNPFFTPFESVGCGYCLSCGGGGHEFVEDTDMEHPKGGVDHYCYIIACVEGACGASDDTDNTSSASEAEDAAILRLVKSVRDGSTASVGQLIDGYESRVVVNLEREALQVTARCDGRAVIAHVPLSAAQVHEATSHLHN